MDLQQYRKEAVDCANKAVELEESGNHEEARKMFSKCINNLKIIVDNDNNKYNIDTYTKKINEYKDRIDYLDKLIDSKNNKKKIPAGG